MTSNQQAAFSSSSSSPADALATSEAIRKYSNFVEEILKPQLKQILKKRDEITQEINEYSELQELILELLATKPKKLKTLVEIGEKFQVRAKIPDPSMIIVDIGLHFHVEMTLEEAKAFVQKHLAHLNA